MILYGYVLMKGSHWIAEGCEQLCEVLHPGIIGGVVLPVLGALPDGMIVLFSGIAGTSAQAQSTLAVGMGTLAGSTIMILTIPYAIAIVVGRMDLEGPKNLPTEGKLTRGWSLRGTGVMTGISIRRSALIAIGVSVTFIVIQGPAFYDLATGATGDAAVRHEKDFALAGFILSIILLTGYLIYSVFNTEEQEAKFEVARDNATRTRALHVMIELLERSRATRARAAAAAAGAGTESGAPLPVPMSLLSPFGLTSAHPHHHQQQGNSNGDLIISVTPFGRDEPISTTLLSGAPSSDSSSSAGPDQLAASVSRMGGRWLNKTRASKYLQGIDSAKEKDAASPAPKSPSPSPSPSPTPPPSKPKDSEEESPQTKSQIWREAIKYLVAGTVLVTVFSDPMVNSITNLALITGIPAFYIAFVVTPIASNATETISTLVFASKKKHSNMNLTFGTIFGATTMNATFVLGLFLALVFFRGLRWTFSAEVMSILVVTIVMCLLAAFQRVFSLLYAIPVILMYPISLGLVAFLEGVIGWT